MVIHHLAGPEPVQEAVVVRPCRDHHLGPVGGGKLHRQMAHATGTGQDQHPLTALEGTMFEQSLPGGEPRQRQCRPLLEADPVELDQLVFARHHRFRIATGRQGKAHHAAHLIPFHQGGDIGADLLHHAGDVITRGPGQLVLVLGRRPAEAGPGLGIYGVDPRKADAHPDFPLGGHLVEGGVEPKYRGVAECGNL